MQAIKDEYTPLFSFFLSLSLSLYLYREKRLSCLFYWFDFVLTFGCCVCKHCLAQSGLIDRAIAIFRTRCPDSVHFFLQELIRKWCSSDVVMIMDTKAQGVLSCKIQKKFKKREEGAQREATRFTLKILFFSPSFASLSLTPFWSRCNCQPDHAASDNKRTKPRLGLA